MSPADKRIYREACLTPIKLWLHGTPPDSWILRNVDLSVLPDPRLDRNELRDVTRDAVLEDRAGAPDHVVAENFRLIRLRDDCTENRRLTDSSVEGSDLTSSLTDGTAAISKGSFGVKVHPLTNGSRLRAGHDFCRAPRIPGRDGIELVYFLRRAI